MLRLTILPLLFFASIMVVLVFGYYLFKKITDWSILGYKKSIDLINKKKRQREREEARKQYPEIVQKGFQDFEKLKENLATLLPEWKQSLSPVIDLAEQILNEIAQELTDNNTELNGKLNTIRPFFNHSLDALLQFVAKLNRDAATMDEVLIEKARQNINLFKADLLKHKQALKNIRHQEFDVLMDVTRERLKK